MSKKESKAKKKVSVKKSIPVNVEVQNDLIELVRRREDIQMRINIICQTYISASGGQGNQYALSKDFKTLQLVENKENGK